MARLLIIAVKRRTISGKVGRLRGLWCQHARMRSAYARLQDPGISGRRLLVTTCHTGRSEPQSSSKHVTEWQSSSVSPHACLTSTRSSSVFARFAQGGLPVNSTHSKTPKLNTSSFSGLETALDGEASFSLHVFTMETA